MVLVYSAVINSRPRPNGSAGRMAISSYPSTPFRKFAKFFADCPLLTSICSTLLQAVKVSQHASLSCEAYAARVTEPCNE